MVKMRVVDQLHVSSLGPDTMGKGAEFEASATMAKDLEKRGLATRVDGDDAGESEGEKAAPAPENKMAPVSANKAAPAAASPAGAKAPNRPA